MAPPSKKRSELESFAHLLYGDQHSDLKLLIQTPLPDDFWKALALALLVRVQKKEPSVATKILRLAITHGRMWAWSKEATHVLPPGIDRDVMQSFVRQLSALDVRRGKIKPELPIPRDTLWVAHALLKEAIKRVRRSIKQGGRKRGVQRAAQDLVDFYGDAIIGRVLREGKNLPDSVMAYVRQTHDSIWQLLIQLHYFTFGVPPPSDRRLKELIVRCKASTPAEASLAILAAVCNVTPQHLRGEISTRRMIPARPRLK